MGAIDRRLVRGFVTDCELEGDSRLLTFWHSWSARGEPLVHHNASLQVLAAGDSRCRVVWIADVLPHEVADMMSGMIEQGLEAMKRTLETAT